MKHLKKYNESTDSELKPFREDIYKKNTNGKIELVSNNFKLIKTFDVRQRGDDKWGTDIVETDAETGQEKLLWRGWYPEDFLKSPHFENGIPVLLGVDIKSLDISVKKYDFQTTPGMRKMIVWITCPVMYAYPNRPEARKWNVYVGYEEELPKENWTNRELNKKRIENFNNKRIEIENIINGHETSNEL